MARSEMLRSRVHLSTLCLATVGMTDLVLTILLFGRGFSEGNPVFRTLLAAFGPTGFVLGKFVLLAGPIALLEYVRTKNERSAEQGTWIAFIAYFLLLAVQFLKLRSL